MQYRIAYMHSVENWDDLRFFLAVARERSLSGAARALGVNQSTVFRRVAQLEGDLGSQLFERGTRGYELTALGDEMIQRATPIEEQVQSLGRLAGGANLAMRGTIRVSTVEELVELLGPHLHSFCESYPEIDLEVVTEERLVSLTRREADIAIRPSAAPEELDVVARKLRRTNLIAAASPAYLGTRRRPRSLSGLKGHSIISFLGNRREAEIFAQLPAGARIRYRSNSMSGKIIAARAGLGVALVPGFAEGPGLEKLFEVGGVGTVHLWLLFHADMRQSAKVRVFARHLEAAMADG